jgi:hypothetical protein
MQHEQASKPGTSPVMAQKRILIMTNHPVQKIASKCAKNPL